MLKLRVFALIAAILLQLSTGSLLAQSTEPDEADHNAALDAAVQDAAERLFSAETIEEPEDGHREPPPWATIRNRQMSVSQVTSPTPELTGPGVADPASSRPSDLLRQVPRVRFEGETAQPVDDATLEADDNDDDVLPEVTPQPRRSTVKPAKKAEPTKKPGLVRGIIGAIPLVGPRIAGTRKQDDKEEREKPEETPERRRAAQSDDDEIDEQAADQAPLLFPPPGEGGALITTSTQIGLSTPIIEPYPAGPAGSNPAVEAPMQPVETPQSPLVAPAATQPVPTATPMLLMAPSSTPVALSTPTPTAPIRVQVGLPTVAQPPAGTATPPVSPAQSPVAMPTSPPLPKPPAIESEAVATPSTLAAVPLVTPLPPTPVQTPAPPLFTPSLEPNDLGLPAPSVEDNTVLYDEFVAAIKQARASNHAAAAKMFRDYGDNHPSSKLAPRAYFLAALLDGDPVRSAEADAALKSQFPKDKYTRRLDERRKAEESPERLERKLADAAGTSAEHQIRVKLAQALLKQGNPRRVRDILEPFIADVAGYPEEADYLMLLSEAYLGVQDLPQATAVLAQIQTKFPEAARNPRVRLNAALVNEEGGYYQRATALYSAILQDSPQSPEAQTAGERLRDLRRLSE